MRAREVLAALWAAALVGVVCGQEDPPPVEDPPPEGEGEEEPVDICVALPFLCVPPEPPAEPSFQVFQDEITGYKFGQWDLPEFNMDGARIYFRVAIPDTAQKAPFETIIQLAAPNTVGWTAMAWGGTMMFNPLVVAFPNCSTVVLSSRWVEERALPGPYPTAKYEIFKAGTFVNDTHWQVTARCTGCTSWQGEAGPVSIDPTNTRHTFAWATGKIPVEDPTNPGTSFAAHDATGTWEHDFTRSSNKNFTGLLIENLYGKGAVAQPVPADTCPYTYLPPAGVLLVTTKVTVSNCPTATTTAGRPALTANALLEARAPETVYVTLQATETVYVGI